MRRTAKSFGVFLCRPNAGEENSDQLFAFCEDEDHVFLRKHFRFFKQAEPSPRLFQLFQANFQFVNEVFTRLGCFYFTVIAIWRSPTTKNLSGEMISRSRIRKSINQSNNPGAELKQSIFQVEARIRLSLGVRLGRSTLGVERWALNLFGARLRTPVRPPLRSHPQSNGSFAARRSMFGVRCSGFSFHLRVDGLSTASYPCE